LQTYATKADESLFQGDGTNGGWNYLVPWDYGPKGPAQGPWNVGSGSEELNGTHDMMGNVSEWMESPSDDPNYGSSAARGQRGGTWYHIAEYLSASDRGAGAPRDAVSSLGFRVASGEDGTVPEPSGLIVFCSLFGTLGIGLAWRRRRKTA
jgi:formylglycine-generating enzyme